MKSVKDLLKSKPDLPIFAFIAIYTLAAVVVSVLRYWQFETHYFDFGIFDKAIWEASRLHAPVVYHMNFESGKNIILADHFNPSIFILSPLYWLTERREVLLVAQAVSVGISAVIGFFIARSLIKSRIAIFAIIVSYLGFIGMQNALITDFHEATIATVPIMLLVWAAMKGKWKTFYLCLFIILGFKETFAGLGVGIGLFLILLKREYLKHGILTIGISLVWAYLATSIIIPQLSGRPYFYAPLNGPEGVKLMLEGIFQLDVRAKTLFYSFATFGFLPAFYLPLLPAISENLISRFISDPPRWTLAFHYSAPLSALMFLSSAFIFQKIEKSKKFKKILIPYSLFIISVVFFMHQFYLRGPLGLAYNSAFYSQTQNIKYIGDFLKKLPRNGLIMTQNDLGVMFSHEDLMLLDKNYTDRKPNHIILNLTPGQNPNNFFPLSQSDALELKKILLYDKNYRLTKFGDELYLFTRIDDKTQR
ncbi:MAG: hypothetical protein A2186_03115 [Candidatus Levybacteria bacterium RIFOXYA1_FULL_41_10]|nr:MAG: hypothetical protein UT44_C0024G0002 [Candidatus Levybacteria bacterium GW2011_GWA1_39_32]KKR50288.1 MAG: hypothetical protein UT87_C0018G0006 [Candidatus Levybacteria bacterium GW2011_GWC1_40_19]KKR94769.1 MAG: hypothetical protein UU45_C0007G0017 [Candidatus Levybacteria bacterium GW2011_GWA2_41_15]OGH21165.1 MAG: hypothetical protein A2695_00890 [Candidatus Levybacteria bacterium RIFCSPHIGHO2_01_FULL_40_83]OGH27415.1 MAG: hypothetical protein A3D82_01835 [Candidatus Levybacteria bact